MKIKFTKAYLHWKNNEVALVNDNFGRKAIAAGLAVNTDAEVTEKPLPEGKGKSEISADIELKKKPSRKRKSVTQSK